MIDSPDISFGSGLIHSTSPLRFIDIFPLPLTLTIILPHSLTKSLEDSILNI
jgi:hypothetical protein